MRPHSTHEIRNVVLFGQKGAGKTTLGEAMLYTAKAITRQGRVDEGTTVLDFEPEEHKRAASVQTSVASTEWNKHTITILDTPGSRDFLGDTLNALGVVEGGLAVVSATDGVEPFTTRLFAQAQPLVRGVVINQMSRDRADFSRALDEVREHLGKGAVPLTIPIGREAGLSGVVDLMSFRAHLMQDGHLEPTIAPVPREVEDEATLARDALFEEIAGTDEALMESYLEEGALAPLEARRGLAQAIVRGDLIPVFAADAARTIGVWEILSAIAEVFPAPGTRQFKDAEGRVVEDDGVLRAVIFKTLMDQHAGKISVFRVVTGSIKKDSTVENSRGHSERLGNLLSLQGKKLIPQEEAVSGDIVAVQKLKDSHTGDTLSSTKETSPLVLAKVPPPQITYRIVPRRKSDEDKIGVALEKLREEDATLQVGHDELTTDMTLAGFGVSHIDVALEKLARKYHVEVDRKPPLVAYRETITRPVTNIEGKHKKQSGGRGQFGVCNINLRPLPRGQGIVFVDNIVGGAIPRQYIPAVQKGIEEAAMHGVRAGYPVVDFEVELYDGKYHEVDSSEMAFKIAGSKAFKEAARKAGVGLLEPVMDVEVEVPKECLGDVVGDVSQRRGRVLGMDTRGGISVVKAQIPQAEILTYAPDLKSMTGGRGSFTAAFSHYDPLPGQLMERVVMEAPNRPTDEGER